MEIPLGDTYYFLFTTRQFLTGAPFLLAGTPALSVYEENNLTQITTGVAVSANYDSVTGLNECSIVATSGNGYEVGKYYSVVITTGTVDGISAVGEVVGHFRIMPAEDAAAGVKDVNVTHVGDAAEDISTATELAKVPKSDGTTTWNPTALGSVNAEVDTAIETYHLHTLLHTTYNSASPPGVSDSLLNELTENDAGETRFTANALENGPGGAGGTTLLQSTTIATLASQTSFTLAAGSSDDNAYNNQMIVITDQLTGTQKAVGLIADTGGYVGSTKTVQLTSDPGIFTMAVDDVVNIFAITGTPFAIEVDANGRVDVGKIAGTAQTAGDVVNVTNTINTTANAIQADLANGTDGLGALSADIATINGKMDTAQLDLDIITGVDGVNLLSATQTSIDNIETDTGTTLDTKINTIDTNVDSILADTGTDGVIIAAAQTVATVTDVTNLHASAATSAALATVDSIVDQLNTAIIYGTSVTGTLSTTVSTTDLTGYLDDELIGRTIIWYSGTADGQAAEITDYATTGGTVTFADGITTPPANADAFKIV